MHAEVVPTRTVWPAPPVDSVALVGADYPGLSLKPLVAPGAVVAAGDPVLADRHHAGIVVAAPASGRVREILRGARRTLKALVIDVDGEGRMSSLEPGPGADPRTALLASGLWAAFRTRPFGHVPPPDAVPDAIFVTAMEPGPHAADPAVVLAGREADFVRGLEALAGLAPGPVFVCHGPGFVPPAVGAHTVRFQGFAGGHAAGLASTHIHALRPVDRRGSVWHIPYREVMAAGHLLETGTPDNERIVALAGTGVQEPRLLRAPVGADLAGLTRVDIVDDYAEILSGGALTARPIRWLGRFDTVVTVRKPAPARDPVPLLTRLLGIRNLAPIPMIPLAALDGAEVAGVPAVPLMRALAARDVETAAALGCLALVEEDVAPLGRLCVSGTDYGPLLRAVLDDLAGGR